MKSIRIKDLEIVEQEQKMEQIPTQTLAELTIENKKKRHFNRTTNKYCSDVEFRN